jgi:hypothetical protein
MAIESLLRPEAVETSIETELGPTPRVQRPPSMGAFQFVVLATLRAAQLIRGCRPRVKGTHKATVLAQFEVAEGIIVDISITPSVAMISPAGPSLAKAL